MAPQSRHPLLNMKLTDMLAEQQRDTETNIPEKTARGRDGEPWQTDIVINVHFSLLGQHKLHLPLEYQCAGQLYFSMHQTLRHRYRLYSCGGHYVNPHVSLPLLVSDEWCRRHVSTVKMALAFEVFVAKQLGFSERLYNTDLASV